MPGMGYHKTLLKSIDTVFRDGSAEDLVKFETHLRENIATSVQLKHRALIWAYGLLIAHYLLSEGRVQNVDLGYFTLANAVLLQLLMLFLGTVCLFAAVVSEFMWRCHRETYDYFVIARRSPLTRTGLHDFQVPASYVLGLDLLRSDGSLLSRCVATLALLLTNTFLVTFPVIYVLLSVRNAFNDDLGEHFGIALVFVMTVLTLIVLSIYVVLQSARLSNPSIVWSFRGTD